MGLGAEVTLCDKKPSVEAFGDYAGTIRRLGVRLSLGENYMDGFRGQDIILRTPGFEYYQKPLQDAIAAGTMVTSEVELFFDLCPCEIVAVTGSDGKTTTTTLISEMFKAAGRTVHLGGNIGAPLLPMLPEVAPTDVAVVELSQLPAHQYAQEPHGGGGDQRHPQPPGPPQGYAGVYRRQAQHPAVPDAALPRGAGVRKRHHPAPCRPTARANRSGSPGCMRPITALSCAETGWLCMAEGRQSDPFLAQKDVKLRGLHNIENLLAAAAAVWGRVPVEAIRQVGSTFTGVEHRIEPVRVLDGVTWYNDSIATSPTRTIAGLRSFDQKIILIAGGYDKKIPYEPLAPELLAHVKTLVLMGATGPRIEAGPGRAGLCRKRPCHLHADSMGGSGGPGPQRG